MVKINYLNKETKYCGNTPMIKVSDKVYGKLEAYNPTGSIKDRLVSYLVETRFSGSSCDGFTFCEATSGNTGIALASHAAKLGVKCKIFMPRNMSEERKQMLRIFGAEIIEVPDNDFEEAIRQRDQFLMNNEMAWSPNQFENRNNIQCHFLTTAHEIHRQMGVDWCAFIHGSGTGGTIMGVSKYAETLGLDIQVGLVLPEEDSHGIQGIGDGRDFLLDRNCINWETKVKTQAAIDRAREFAKESGILVGISSGANIIAAERYRDETNPDKNIVTILADRGERYLSIYK